MSHDTTPRDSRDSAFAAAASELVDEVQSTIRDEEPTAAPARRDSLALPIVLGVVFSGVMAWNVVSFRSSAAPLSPVEARRSEGVLVFVATQAVEGFEVEHGRLPVSLDEAGIEASGLVYSVRPDGFSIASVASGTEGAAVEFEQGDQVDGFLMGLGIVPPEAMTPEPGG